MGKSVSYSSYTGGISFPSEASTEALNECAVQLLMPGATIKAITKTSRNGTLFSFTAKSNAPVWLYYSNNTGINNMFRLAIRPITGVYWYSTPFDTSGMSDTDWYVIYFHRINSATEALRIGVFGLDGTVYLDEVVKADDQNDLYTGTGSGAFDLLPSAQEIRTLGACVIYKTGRVAGDRWKAPNLNDPDVVKYIPFDEETGTTVGDWMGGSSGICNATGLTWSGDDPWDSSVSPPSPPSPENNDSATRRRRRVVLL